MVGVCRAQLEVAERRHDSLAGSAGQRHRSPTVAAMPGSTRFLKVYFSVLLLAALMTIAGCSGSKEAEGDQSTDSGGTAVSKQPTKNTQSPRPPSSPPDKGQCRDLVFADIGLFSDQSTKVSCGDVHTAYTFAVETLPREVAFDGVDIQNDAVQSAAAQSCGSIFPSFIGGDAPTRALARLTVTYFLPTQSDFDRGANWVRCDVVALQSAQALAPLPRDLQGILDDVTVLVKLGLCSDGDPGAPDSALVMCTEPHTSRALSAVRLGDDRTSYPGGDMAKSTGMQCEEIIGDALRVNGGFTYVWTYPSPADWTAGQRFGYCWHQTDE